MEEQFAAPSSSPDWLRASSGQHQFENPFDLILRPLYDITYISYKTVIVSKLADKIVGHCYQKESSSLRLPGIEEESESIIKYT